MKYTYIFCNATSPESNYNRLVYGVQNDGIIGYRYTDNISCGTSINSIHQNH